MSPTVLRSTCVHCGRSIRRVGDDPWSATDPFGTAVCPSNEADGNRHEPTQDEIRGGFAVDPGAFVPPAVADRSRIESPLPGDYVQVPYQDVRGHVLRLPDGVTVVPYHPLRDGWWNAVVVASTDNRYPVGGYDLALSPRQVAEAERIELPEP